MIHILSATQLEISGEKSSFNTELIDVNHPVFKLRKVGQRLWLRNYLGLEFGYPLDPYLVEHYYPNRSSFHSYHSVSPTVHSNLSDNMPSSPDSHYSQSHSPNSNCTSLVLTQSSRTRQSRRPSADLDKKRIHKCSYEGTFTVVFVHFYEITERNSDTATPFGSNGQLVIIFGLKRTI